MSLRAMRPACVIGLLLAASLAAQDQPKVPEPAEPTTGSPPATTGASPSRMTATEPAMAGTPNPSRTIGGETAPVAMGPPRSMTGEVLRYEPGRSVVLRGSDGVDRTFALPSNLNVPPDIPIGSRLTLVTRAAADGSIQVREVRSAEPAATSSGPPDRQAAGGVSTRRPRSTVTLYRVSAYEPGKSITLSRPEGFAVTLRIDRKSKVPADVAVGRTVSVVTRRVSKKLTVRTLRIEAE